jgi:hypothetical protein
MYMLTARKETFLWFRDALTNLPDCKTSEPDTFTHSLEQAPAMNYQRCSWPEGYGYLVSFLRPEPFRIGSTKAEPESNGGH